MASKPSLQSRAGRLSSAAEATRAPPEISSAAKASKKEACTSRRIRSSRIELVGVVLDHGVGEQVLAYALYRCTRGRLARRAELHLDVLALAHVFDAGDAERRQRMLDRLALRVEHTGF